MLERPVGLNSHFTRGGLPVPLSSALSLPVYTSFFTAVSIFKNDVDASSSGAVVQFKDLKGELSSFFTSNNKLSDILAILDAAEAEHVLLYLSTPSTQSRYWAALRASGLEMPPCLCRSRRSCRPNSLGCGRRRRR